ncbi:MAG: DNA methyltransferase [Chloroherpetonaceae bacterium]|nr:DNA methyltransferase [Chloroherpetonaceae bacterium]
MKNTDYSERNYLSASEAAKFLQITVNELHLLTKSKKILGQKSASGQLRYKRADLLLYSIPHKKKETVTKIELLGFERKVKQSLVQLLIGNSAFMKEVSSESIHLIITSPPYYNAKMYSRVKIKGDLGDIHNADKWFEEIGSVWRECFRVLQPGRKIFINIMNLPLRLSDGGYRTMNLVGKTIDLCESIGFIFKRDIIWQKTNGVRAHFGTYPYPGGILINNMHEFILEFDKPKVKSGLKYPHVSKLDKERSKLTKEFWLSIKNSDVWLMKPEASGDNRTHVAPFPKELPHRLIRAFSYRSETILDPFAGSATTLIAASELERNAIGYELNPEIASEAWKKIDEL